MTPVSRTHRSQRGSRGSEEQEILSVSFGIPKQVANLPNDGGVFKK